MKAEANLVVRVHRGGLRRPVGGWSKIVAEIRVISEVTIRAEVRYGFGRVAAAFREMRFEGGGFGIQDSGSPTKNACASGEESE